MHIWVEAASMVRMDDPATRTTLFGQRAR
jgi:hypothetical protein